MRVFEWKSVSHTHRAFGSKFSNIYKTNMCIISSIFSFFIKFREYYSFNWHKYFESCDLYMFVCTCRVVIILEIFSMHILYTSTCMWITCEWLRCLWVYRVYIQVPLSSRVLTFITDPSLVYHITHDFTDSFYLIINLRLNLIVFPRFHDIYQSVSKIKLRMNYNFHYVQLLL